MMLRRFIIPAAILVLFFMGAATLMATAPQLEPSTPEPIATTVRVRDVVPASVRLKVHSQGTVQPSTETQLIPEVSGRVIWMSPNLVAGGYFASGDPLVRIDTKDYANARGRAKAALERAEAEHEHALFEFQRLKSLAERKLTSRSQLENALRALRVAEAALEDARVAHVQSSNDLARAEISAPFTGLVRSEAVDIGQFISRGAPIATLYASDVVEVRLPIADRQLAFLNVPVASRGELAPDNQPSVVLRAEYAGRDLEWHGRIVRSEAEIDSTSRMVQLVARVSNEEQPVPLSVGLFVEAEIDGLEVDDVVVLPRSSLRNNNQVLVVDSNDRLHFRNVEPLRLYQDDVLVKDGLSAGERVCISPLQTPIEGMTVKPVVEEAG